MKKVIIGIVIVLAIGALGLVLFGDKQTTNTAQPAAEPAYAAVQTDLDSGAILIDVRTAEEFSAGHIEGAVNIPNEDIQDGTMPTTDKDTKLYVYCRSGNRSAQAKTALEAAGYTNVEDLGGMDEVVAMGGKQVQ